MQTFILIALPIAFGISGQLLLKTGMNQIGKFAILTPYLIIKFIKIFMNPFVFSGFVCYAVSSLIWLITLSRVPLSYAYPLVSINYIGILIASKFLFHEDVNMVRWAGVMVICAGVILVSRS